MTSEVPNLFSFTTGTFCFSGNMFGCRMFIAKQISRRMLPNTRMLWTFSYRGLQVYRKQVNGDYEMVNLHYL